MRWLGPGALAIVRPTGVLLLDFFAPVFSCMYCGVLMFALTPFFNLNLYVLEENSWIS